MGGAYIGPAPVRPARLHLRGVGGHLPPDTFGKLIHHIYLHLPTFWKHSLPPPPPPHSLHAALVCVIQERKIFKKMTKSRDAAAKRTNTRGVETKSRDAAAKRTNTRGVETKSRDAAAKRTNTRGVGISNVYEEIYILSTIVIHTFNFAQVQSMDDNCGEWVECMGVASGSGWNLWV